MAMKMKMKVIGIKMKTLSKGHLEAAATLEWLWGAARGWLSLAQGYREVALMDCIDSVALPCGSGCSWRSTKLVVV
jgi:hypothetical protein